MAEFGAHLTTTVGVTPSIFEVLATEGLSNGLKYAFKHLMTVLAETNPARYHVLLQYNDEFYVAIDLVVQCYHLKKYNASFSENFYGLRRTSRLKENQQLQLSRTQLNRSVLLLVGLPYILSLIHKHYSKLKESEGETNENLKVCLEKRFLHIYPYLHFISSAVLVSYQLLYAVGRIPFHTPFLHLALCELHTLTKSDLMNSPFKPDQDNSLLLPVRLILQKTATLLASIMSVGAFFLQFIEWWYSQEGIPKSIGTLPITDPPQNSPSFKPGICPICNSTIKNTTLLTTSGYVFCYRCIHQSLSLCSQCPVTKYPANHNGLIKLYPPDD